MANKTIPMWMFPKIGGFPPKSSILIGFSIIFTIHFGVPLFLAIGKNTNIFPLNGGEKYGDSSRGRIREQSPQIV